MADHSPYDGQPTVGRSCKSRPQAWFDGSPRVGRLCYFTKKRRSAGRSYDLLKAHAGASEPFRR